MNQKVWAVSKSVWKFLALERVRSDGLHSFHCATGEYDNSACVCVSAGASASSHSERYFAQWNTKYRPGRRPQVCCLQLSLANKTKSCGCDVSCLKPQEVSSSPSRNGARFLCCTEANKKIERKY